MLHEMRIETGIDLAKLIEASRAAQETLGRPLGRMSWVPGRSTGRARPTPRVDLLESVSLGASDPRSILCRAMRSDRFRAAAEEKNFSAVDELFAERASFRSPVVFAPYEGRESIRCCSGPSSRCSRISLHRSGRVGRHRCSRLEARVGDRELNGVDILRFDADDRIVELMVMVRPMSGMHALAEAMQTRLAGGGSG